MKYISALTCILLTTLSAPVFALQGADCAAKGEKINQTERKEFIKTCLAQAEAPSNVQQEELKHKKATCEQNAKNKKLQGKALADYHAECMNKNEAAAVKSSQLKNDVALNSPAEPNTSPSKPGIQKQTAKKQAVKKQKTHKKDVKKAEKQPAKTPDANAAK
jgi:hypothetical protein